MTSDAVRNITDVLAMNSITLTAKLNRDFSDKSRLETLPFEYDNEQLRNTFMHNPAGSKLSIENNRHIYRNDWESLSININNGYVAYRNRDITQGIPKLEYAESLCRDFLKKINAIYPDFVSDMPRGLPYETEEGLVFEYRQAYKGYIVNSNFLIITVGENGINRVEFIYARVSGFSREMKSICAPDEALITCMYEIQNIYGNRPVTIEQMDLVYHQPEAVGVKNTPAYATPFYRVFILESVEPILVNAFTNTVEHVQI
jgi:hypothetical protein